MAKQRLTATALVGMLADAGYEAESYSGRYMYGRRCVSVTTDDHAAILGAELVRVAVDAAVRETDDDMVPADAIDERVSDVVAVLRGTRSDSMGLSSVHYWPDVEWDMPQDDDEDE